MIRQLKKIRSNAGLPSWGFTLIELAIVLGVAGILFAGLWRLMSGGNQQLRDQAAASAQTQLINATKNYLSSNAGLNYIMVNDATASPFYLALPASNKSKSDCLNYGYAATASANLKAFCNYLPTGLTSGSTNSYGQIYNILVLGDGSGTSTLPNTFSYLILTSGGDQIPDSSGGRISAAIGGDGGFVYSNSVCGAPAAANTMACGAYGAWQAALSTYIASPVSAPTSGGYIASRTYYNPLASSTNPWIARGIYPTDAGNLTSPTFNTMVTSLIFASAPNANGNDNNLYLNEPAAGITTTSTGKDSIQMNGGPIVMGGGNITTAGALAFGAATAIASGITGVTDIEMSGVGNKIDLNGGKILDSSGTEQISLTTGATPLTSGSALVNLGTGCSLDSGIALFRANSGLAGCTPGIQDTGDALISGRVNVNSLYATTFIYQGSDIRLKKNIRRLADPLADVMRLNPVSYNLKASGTPAIGVIAQDVEKVYPQLVSERGDGMKSVNYEGLIAPLIGAVQELQKENETLKQQLQFQKTQIDNLEKDKSLRR